MENAQLRCGALVIVALACLASEPLRAQVEGPPIYLPPLKREAAVIVKAINRDSVILPTAMVAKIDDQVLTQAQLLWHLLESNLDTIAKNLLDSKLIELEMQRGGIVVSDEALQEELQELLPRVAPGQTLEQLVQSGVYSLSYLQQVARINRGRKELFWRDKNIKVEDRKNESVNQFFMQVWLNEIKNKYQLTIRGQNPPPPEGALAGLTTIIDGKKVAYVVTAEEAMEFLLGILRPAAILSGVDELIESAVVEREMAKAQIRVTDTEIEGWVREMRAKYEGPFNWDMILRVQGLTPDKAKRRWRDVQAWKRCTGVNFTDKDVMAFREANDDFFRSRHVKVRHILFKFADDVSGLSKGPEAEAAALERAKTVERLAREGVDFQELAKTYSDDVSTQNAGGMIGQPIKKWGGGYDPDFQKAAYALTRGQISAPVKSSFGWHVIYCEEESPPTNRDIDWTNPRYAEWITDEYENAMAQAWKDGLESAAKISKATPEEILKLKDTKFERSKAQNP